MVAGGEDGFRGGERAVRKFAQLIDEEKPRRAGSRADGRILAIIRALNTIIIFAILAIITTGTVISRSYIYIMMFIQIEVGAILSLLIRTFFYFYAVNKLVSELAIVVIIAASIILNYYSLLYLFED